VSKCPGFNGPGLCWKRYTFIAHFVTLVKDARPDPNCQKKYKIRIGSLRGETPTTEPITALVGKLTLDSDNQLGGAMVYVVNILVLSYEKLLLKGFYRDNFLELVVLADRRCMVSGNSLRTNSIHDCL